MRKFVSFTAIMLLALQLSATWGKVTVSVAHATQNPLRYSSTQPTPLPLLSLKTPTPCSVPTTAYHAETLQLAAKRPVPHMSVEIEAKIAPQTIETSAAETLPMVASVALEYTPTPDAAAVPTVSVSPVPLQSVSTPTPAAGASGVLNADTLYTLVNQARTQAGLPAFEKHPDICSVAWSRAPELDNEIYGSGYMHAGFQARQLPYWATENMISQQTEQEALQWWMNSSVHRSAILGDYKFACVACQGRSCAMIFSNLTPK